MYYMLSGSRLLNSTWLFFNILFRGRWVSKHQTHIQMKYNWRRDRLEPLHTAPTSQDAMCVCACVCELAFNNAAAWTRNVRERVQWSWSQSTSTKQSTRRTVDRSLPATSSWVRSVPPSLPAASTQPWAHCRCRAQTHVKTEEWAKVH